MLDNRLKTLKNGRRLWGPSFLYIYEQTWQIEMQSPYKENFFFTHEAWNFCKKFCNTEVVDRLKDISVSIFSLPQVETKPKIEAVMI